MITCFGSSRKSAEPNSHGKLFTIASEQKPRRTLLYARHQASPRFGRRRQSSIQTSVSDYGSRHPTRCLPQVLGRDSPAEYPWCPDIAPGLIMGNLLGHGGAKRRQRKDKTRRNSGHASNLWFRVGRCQSKICSAQQLERLFHRTSADGILGARRWGSRGRRFALSTQCAFEHVGRSSAAHTGL